MEWVMGITRALVVVALNLIPIWGFTREDWSPGTTLALYWVQSLVGIPVTAALIFLHRRATHKVGHYSGISTTSIDGGPPVTTRTTFLNGFLWMSIPFVVAHGIFLGALLGLMWRTAPGAVSLEDLRQGIAAMLNVMALGFAFDTLHLAHRPFAWIVARSQSLIRRTMVVQMTILVGMAIAVFADKDTEAFFAVFLVLKLLADLSGELPQWNPREPPRWIVRLMNRIGGPDADFGADWKKTWLEEKAEAEADERVVDPAAIARR